jgi:hypothetical protein
LYAPIYKATNHRDFVRASCLPSSDGPQETERKGSGRSNAWPESCVGDMQ